jgi:hypothetical protein
MEAGKQIGKEDAECIAAELEQVGTLLLTVLRELNRSEQASALQELIVPALEKAGSMTDRCIKDLGGTAVCGDFYDWVVAKSTHVPGVVID